jgi:hypothetical protein
MIGLISGKIHRDGRTLILAYVRNHRRHKSLLNSQEGECNSLFCKADHSNSECSCEKHVRFVDDDDGDGSFEDFKELRAQSHPLYRTTSSEYGRLQVPILPLGIHEQSRILRPKIDLLPFLPRNRGLNS